MNTVLIFKTAIVLSVFLFLIPKKFKLSYSLLLHTLVIFATSTWAVTSLYSSEPVKIDLGIPFWSGTPFFIIDKLSAFFILLINFTSLTALVYGKGYLKPYLEKKSTVTISLHLIAFFMLQTSMLHIVMMRDGFAFLMSWEMMSLSSFILVIFEGEKESTLKTGINYLVQMHVCFLLILSAFLISYQVTGHMGFDSLGAYFTTHRGVWLFLLFFAGFGIKAGFVPLHSWLPHAHPAAPSHVSGLMSGVMIKMGIYGILRVFTYVQNDFMEIGGVVLTISIITGLTGILYAIFQHDIKKILAYSSIENIGIIGLGVGTAIVGKAMNNDLLGYLGISGALLHTLNHSLYKSLLFYSAGNVYFTAHSRNQNKLGGLIKQMPFTGTLFLVGSLAISGIPPLNGFISEFLIYNSVFQKIGKADFFLSLVSIAVILSLVLIGGLSVYCFTKAFGLSFLGTARSQLSHAKEVPPIMFVPGIAIVAIMISIGFFPNFFLQFITNIISVFPQWGPSDVWITTMQEPMNNLGLVNILIITSLLVVFTIRALRKRDVSTTYGPTWGCGYAGGDATHQYTATSYADSLKQIAEPVLLSETHYTPIHESEIFPSPRKFKTETRDLLEEKIVVTPVNAILRVLPKAGMAQTGLIHHYLIYPLVFLIIIGILTFLNII